MSAKTKIVVIKLKDVLFYATVAMLVIITLLLLFILFQPDAQTTNSTIEVKYGQHQMLSMSSSSDNSISL